MSANEKEAHPVETHEHQMDHEVVHVVKTVHADGVTDLVDAKAVGGDVKDMPKGYYYSPQFIGTVLAQCVASICAYLGWVLPANTLSLINEDIGPSANLNWVATAWTLGSAVGFLLVGRISDIFGRKWMVMGTQVLCLIGMIMGATAKSINVLIGAELLNGLSAAAQLSFGIVLGEIVPNSARGPIVTIVFLSSLPFAVFGPVIARSFILQTAAGWRWSFYLGIIFDIIALALYAFFYHPPRYSQLHVHGKTVWEQFKALDFGGIFLFCAGMALFLIGLSWGGTAYPWASAHVVSTIIGWQSSVVGGGVLLGQCMSGFAISYVPKVKIQTIIAGVLAAVFVGALASIDVTRHAATIALGVLGCVAIGYVDNISFPGVTLVWEPQDIGLATGVMGSIRAVGGAVAQALYVSILTNKVAHYMPEYISPAAVSAGLPESSLPALFTAIAAGTGNFSSVPGFNAAVGAAVGEQLKHAYRDSFRIVFYTTIPFSVLLIIGACFVPNMEKYLSGNVAKRLQKMGSKDGEAKVRVIR
ncbi:trichothecene efflux pump [Rhizodiscina lignyota]|uniref:Trichothecene efflux pump n=1 Tax=Rhizodiscina lignyota TaxID=1504668 RepID=A0A9P4IJH1_9PEZI|nr:trichothecene efflux pump [Rhizodiscina lignyota]